MRSKVLMGLLTLACSTSVAAAEQPAPYMTGATQRRLTTLVQGFVEAQRKYDQKQLRSLTTEEYIEISPRGEIDPREKMLSFYAVRPNVPSPLITTHFESVRTYGNTGMVVATMNMAVTDGKGGTVQRSLRATMMACCDRAGCKLVTAQYTPVR